MEIKIRNIHPATVRKLDELASKNNVSRQIYLKEHLESFAVNDLHTNIIDRYENQLNANMLLLEKTNETLESVIDTFKELIDDE